MSKKALTNRDIGDWLKEELPKHERLTATASALIENILKKNKIEFLSVTYRVKTLPGALEKIQRKEYRDPQTQLTDLSGVRVITYLEDQVHKISKTIKDLFNVDEKNSRDRSEALGDDRVGYRSTHFVCTLGQKRAALPEYESLGALKFEIQVRTVLQHAWAELAHDRSFKFGNTLPASIQRKLNLHSGLLELVDSAFDEISKEIDSYKTSLDMQKLNQILDVEINSLSLARFLDELAVRHQISFPRNDISSITEQELRDFGIKTIGDLEKVMTPEFLDQYKKEATPRRTASGFVRQLMLHADIEKALDAMPMLEWVSPAAFQLGAAKHGKEKLEQALAARQIIIWDPLGPEEYVPRNLFEKRKSPKVTR